MAETNTNIRTREELEEMLLDCGAEGAIMLDGYESAAIGVTTNNEVVYSYWDMVDALCRDDNMTEEEAVEWIDYNTIRAIGYINGGKKPIIIINFNDIGFL